MLLGLRDHLEVGEPVFPDIYSGVPATVVEGPQRQGHHLRRAATQPTAQPAFDRRSIRETFFGGDLAPWKMERRG
eukprot:6751759-Pyramimonas_sp.AAC.1